MALTRPQAVDAIALLITDPTNKQNTAARIRDAIAVVLDSSANLLDDASLLNPAILLPHDPSLNYPIKSGVFFGGEIYQANIAIAPSAFNSLNWTQKTGLTTPSEYGFSPWDNLTNYTADPIADNRVEDENILYKSKSVNQGKKPKDFPADWEVVSANSGSFAVPHFNGFFKKFNVVTQLPDKLFWLDVDTSVDPFESADFDQEIIDGKWKPFNSNVYTQTVQTPDNVQKLVPGSRVLPADSVRSFKTRIIGIQTSIGTEGAVGNIYDYEVEGQIKNIAGTMTISNITGTNNGEGFALPIDPSTGHAINVTVNGATKALDYKVSSLDADVNWRFDTEFNENIF